SRASLLTGLATHNHRMRTNSLTKGYPVWQGGPHFHENLPVWLQRSGYRTAHFGKYVNGYGFNPETEVPPGWERWVTPTKYAGAGYYGSSLNIDGRVTAPVGSWQQRDTRQCVPVFYTLPGACQYSTDVLTAFALKEIAANAGSGRPFFMQLDYNAPHDDGRLDPGPVVPARLKHLPAKVRQNFRLPDDDPLPGSPYFFRRNEPLTQEVKSDIRTRFANEVTALRGVDEGVGRVIGSLRHQGLLENTYVIFTSDNGFFHGEHRVSYGKYLPHEPSTRQPLIVRGPGIPRGEMSRAPGSNLSIASTILKMTGSRGRGPRDGRPLLSNLRFPKLESEVPVLLEGFNGRPRSEPEQFLDGSGNQSPNQAVVINYSGFVAGDLKYVNYAYGEEELYDLSKDPDEARNRIDWARYSGVVQWARKLDGRLSRCDGAGCQKDVTPPDLEPFAGSG
ncbi:MAG: sulfatase-like hydrolase/transferase, partial [Solirubrobacterales bacterium]